jgi:hypothetical protein
MDFDLVYLQVYKLVHFPNRLRTISSGSVGNATTFMTASNRGDMPIKLFLCSQAFNVGFLQPQ